MPFIKNNDYNSNFDIINNLILEKKSFIDSKKNIVWNGKSKKIKDFDKGTKGKIEALFYSLKHKNTISGTKAKKEFQKEQAKELLTSIKNLSNIKIEQLNKLETSKLIDNIKKIQETNKINQIKAILSIDKTSNTELLIDDLDQLLYKLTVKETIDITAINNIRAKIALLSAKDPKDIPKYINTLASLNNNPHINNGDINMLIALKSIIPELNTSLTKRIKGIIENPDIDYIQKDEKINELINELKQIQIAINQNENIQNLKPLNDLKIPDFIKQLKESGELLIYDEFLNQTNPANYVHSNSFENFFFHQLTGLTNDQLVKAIDWFVNLEFKDNSMSGLVARKITAMSLEAEIVNGPNSPSNISKLTQLCKNLEHAVDIMTLLSDSSKTDQAKQIKKSIQGMTKGSVQEIALATLKKHFENNLASLEQETSEENLEQITEFITYLRELNKLSSVNGAFDDVINQTFALKIQHASSLFQINAMEFFDIKPEEIPIRLKEIKEFIEKHSGGSSEFGIAIQKEMQSILNNIVSRFNTDTVTRNDQEVVITRLQEISRLKAMEAINLNPSIDALSNIAMEEQFKQLIDKLIPQLTKKGEQTDLIIRTIQESILQIKDEASQSEYLKKLYKSIPPAIVSQINTMNQVEIKENLLLANTLVTELKKFNRKELYSTKLNMEELAENLENALDLVRNFTYIQTNLENSSSKQETLTLYKQLGIALFDNQEIFEYFPRLGENIKNELKNNEIFQGFLLEPAKLKEAFKENQKNLKEAMKDLRASESDVRVKKELRDISEEKLKPLREDYLEDYQIMADAPPDLPFLKNIDWEHFKNNFDDFVDVILQDASLGDQLSKKILEIEIQLKNKVVRTFKERTANQTELEKYGIKAAVAINEHLLQQILDATQKQIKTLQSTSILHAIGFISPDLAGLQNKADLLEKSIKDIRNNAETRENEINALKQTLNKLERFKLGLKKSNQAQAKMVRSTLRERSVTLNAAENEYKKANAIYEEKKENNDYLLIQDKLLRQL